MIKDITFITVNYAPEDTAIGLYTSQLAEFLVTKGYNVSVITGFPYYPMWKIPENYQDKPRFYSEEINGVKIYRYKFYVPENQNFFHRILHILSFNFGNFFNLRKIKKADLVFCNIPFTTNVVLGLFLKRRLKAKLWTSIKDFEFDAAYESGLLKQNPVSGAFKKLLYKIERYLYVKSDIISSISFKMVDRIKLKAPQTNPVFFPDWVDVDFINPNNYSQHDYISKEKFTVLYSGNIGQKQNWEVYINLAKKLQQFPDIEFILVGEGAYKQELLQVLKDNNLMGFIKYYEPIPYEDLSNLLCSADLHLLFQKSDVIDSVMPSKILGMMSSARPSIITGDLSSEVARHINSSQGWGYYTNDDSDAIYNAVLALKNDKNLQKETGEKARAYMVENFSKNMILNSFIEKINTL
ncbi:WcaI family glycosyltransferase [Flavobacterium cerinum]|uniref:WcaI family glycosyltransferase n=1 Tax=Flavobacterium cerinum TaxID=2502784 RepID=A0ABY5IV65_9FLAO|nr:WcaI family glycosyltransferase [Flavobacterium cerinum]UUC46271.1 WcaI family glycosyltransferase [Flavobacterium cerinum]